MDEYPAFSLDHNVPLLVTLGFSTPSTHHPALSRALQAQAIVIGSELPPVEHGQGHTVLQYMLNHQAIDVPCNGREPPPRHRFSVRTVGRSFPLPPRRANLPDHFEKPPSTPVLHSPFSPLTPISPLYPDGLIDAQWLRKHQELVPSILLCFYDLTSDPTLAPLNDNQIKKDLNKIRGLLSQSGYRTRLAVVLLTDEHGSSDSSAHERLENIRRACGLDTKALFLVSPPASQEELERVAENMLVTLYGTAIDYYRDLGRHARKKRGRGTAPQPTVPPTNGTSQTLSLAGWSVRYDFKSGVFAEFRQEMDQALRSYEQAYENLLSCEMMEMIPNWSPRWNEARQLADVVAIRHLASLLWTGQHTGAVRRWQAHRERMADLVNRCGRGTTTYGWAAWKARWATVMANLLERARVPDLFGAKPFLRPEKAVSGERLQPWEHMHHTGYWYRMASRHLYSRRTLAQSIPADDRQPPSASPGVQKSSAYDTYMCPEPHKESPLPGAGPGVDHGRLILDSLGRARREFEKRNQPRLVAEISIESAREHAAVQAWPCVVALLQPLWETRKFQTDGWFRIAEELSWALRAAAAKMGNAKLLLALDWELMNRVFTRRADGPFDLARSLEGLRCEKKVFVRLRDDTSLSFLSASFLFKDDEGRAGQSSAAQLAITSHAHHESSSLVLSRLRIDFEGTLKPFVIHHGCGRPEAQRKAGLLYSTVALEEAPKADELQGTADLTLVPGHLMVFRIDVPLREPGESSASKLTLSVEAKAFDLQHVSVFGEATNSDAWYLSASSKKRIARPTPMRIRVLPRPPKMAIKTILFPDQIYTNEPISLEFDMINAEDVDATAGMEVFLFGDDPVNMAAFVLGERSDGTLTFEGGQSRLQGVPLGSIESAKSIRVGLEMRPMERASRYELTIHVSYHLATDPQTPIVQTAVFFLNVVNPFEANYDLLPRLHPDPWPSFFDPDGVQEVSSDDGSLNPPKGLSQTWCLVARYASFVSEDLRVMDMDMAIRACPAVHCVATKRSALSKGGHVVKPKSIEEARFDLVAQKRVLEGGNPSTLDMSLLIKWVRNTDTDRTANTTILPVPRLAMFGTEPRVLAKVSYLDLDEAEQTPPAQAQTTSGPPPPRPRLLVLDVVIENASSHLLTFGVSLERADEFAFSGPKKTTINVLPVTRRAVTYRLLPLAGLEADHESKPNEGGPPETKEGEGWVRLPGLTVRDQYFQKVLRIIPTERLRVDKETGGLSAWLPRYPSEATEGQTCELIHPRRAVRKVIHAQASP